MPRHLTSDEKNNILKIVDDAGVGEVLHLIGQIIAHNHRDLHVGSDYRTRLSAVARMLGRDEVWQASRTVPTPGK